MTTTATVSNVVPVVATFAGATNLLPGETYTATGSFTDPGSDPWTATVDYGDGSGVKPLALVGKTFALSHVYAAAGSFTVTVRVSDDDATSAPRTATVTVITASQGVTNAIAIVEGLVTNEKLNGGNANSLESKLDNAKKSLDKDNANAASGKLGALLNELDAMVQSGRLSAADAEPLRAIVQRILDSIS